LCLLLNLLFDVNFVYGVLNTFNRFVFVVRTVVLYVSGLEGRQCGYNDNNYVYKTSTGNLFVRFKSEFKSNDFSLIVTPFHLGMVSYVVNVTHTNLTLIFSI